MATTVQLIGSKWKLLIMRNLLVRPWRFNELMKSLDGISQKVLTESLHSMEDDGIIIRTVFPEVPPHVEYSLSEVGESMRPIIPLWKPGAWTIRKRWDPERYQALSMTKRHVSCCLHLQSSSGGLHLDLFPVGMHRLGTSACEKIFHGKTAYLPPILQE